MLVIAQIYTICNANTPTLMQICLPQSLQTVNKFFLAPYQPASQIKNSIQRQFNSVEKHKVKEAKKKDTGDVNFHNLIKYEPNCSSNNISWNSAFQMKPFCSIGAS